MVSLSIFFFSLSSLLFREAFFSLSPCRRSLPSRFQFLFCSGIPIRVPTMWAGASIGLLGGLMFAYQVAFRIQSALVPSFSDNNQIFCRTLVDASWATIITTGMTHTHTHTQKKKKPLLAFVALNGFIHPLFFLKLGEKIRCLRHLVNEIIYIARSSSLYSRKNKTNRRTSDS